MREERRPPRSRDCERGEISLIVAYHESARAELVNRMERRDSAIFLYLAAVATLLAVFLPQYPEGAAGLMIVPLLGYGASLIHAQHNIAMGALGIYIGVELQAVASKVVGSEEIRCWDGSNALTRIRGENRPRGVSSIVMLVVPSGLTCILGTVALPTTPVNVSLVLCSLLLTGLTVHTILQAERARHKDAQIVKQATDRALVPEVG